MFSRFSKQKTLLLGLILLAFVFLLTLSSSADNIRLRGQGLWKGVENNRDYGYIYFNCEDARTGNFFDEAGNLAGAGTFFDPFTPEEFHFDFDPCLEIGFAVELDDFGLLSGDAWNPSVGIISFEYDGFDPPDNYAFASNCQGVCDQGNPCLACYNFSDQKLYGWGRIEHPVVPDQGSVKWVRLDAYSDPNKSAAIYTNDSEQSPYPGANLNLGDLAGRGQSTYDGEREISLNCETENYPLPGTCLSNDYRVYIKDLVIGRLSAPNWSFANACSSGAIGATLRWQRLSGVQTAYEVVINTKDSFSLDNNDYIYYSGKRPSSASQINLRASDGLNYDTAYYWWVRGYDDEDKPTNWIQYTTNTGYDSDANRDGNNLTFQTFEHEFPNPFFSWQPENPLTSTSTTFISESFVYTPSSRQTPISCDSQPALCDYLWTTTDFGAVITDPNSSQTEISFYNATNTTIFLELSDQTGYYCSTSTSLRVNYDLPLWREVKAQDY